MVAELLVAKLPVAVVNPRQVRRFAEALGYLAKTDPLDARVLAHFAAAIQPPTRDLPDAETRALADQLARRRPLVEMLTMEKNRQQQAQQASVRHDIQRHIDWLQPRLKTTESGLRKAVEASPIPILPFRVEWKSMALHWDMLVVTLVILKDRVNVQTPPLNPLPQGEGGVQ